MYIPPFICGVVFTLLAEFLACVVYAIVTDRKGSDDDAEGGN